MGKDQPQPERDVGGFVHFISFYFAENNGQNQKQFYNLPFDGRLFHNYCYRIECKYVNGLN